jgi:16S rRNA (uracil1498-N3)-methyltransferase
VASPVLADPDRHHLERVLRLRPGDPLAVGDGAGAWRRCRFGDPLEPVGGMLHVPRPEPLVTVGFTPVKGDRPEWAVQKLTELSVDRLVVLRTERSVVQWEGERAAHHLERLARIAREAAMQSRRAWLPELVGVVGLGEALTEPGAVLADAGGRTLTEDHRTVLCGPEGGWSEAELASSPDRVSLGPTVLRAETAAVAAGALLVALRDGLVRPAP